MLSKFRAGVLYAIPNSELEYCVPSQSMYWYILGQNSGPWSGIRAIRALSPLSSFQSRGVELGKDAIIKVLLNSGADKDLKISVRLTALNLVKGKPVIIKLLLATQHTRSSEVDGVVMQAASGG